MAVHPSHPDIIKRLKRAEGHLRSIVTMLEEGRDCLEIAQQMQAVESAVGNAKKTLVHDHIDHCLEHAVEGVGARDAISQFKAITKYLRPTSIPCCRAATPGCSFRARSCWARCTASSPVIRRR